MAFRAGDLVHRLMIQTSVSVQSDSSGVPKLAWRDSDWIWCRVKPVSEGEQTKATGQVTLGVYRIECRWRDAEWITAKMRGRWLDMEHTFEFTGLAPEPNKDELTIEATKITG